MRSGVFDDTQAAGDYAIAVTATSGGAPVGVARSRFLVYEQDLELDNAVADPTLLASLSAMTREAGGQSLAPEELPDLLRRIEEKPLEMRSRVAGQAHPLGHLALLPAVRWPDQHGVVSAQAVGAGLTHARIAPALPLFMPLAAAVAGSHKFFREFAGPGKFGRCCLPGRGHGFAQHRWRCRNVGQKVAVRARWRYSGWRGGISRQVSTSAGEKSYSSVP